MGNGCHLAFVGWRPDRDLNPQYDHLPDVDKFGAVYTHKRPDNGEDCLGAITFEGAVQAEVSPDGPRWTVYNLDPLTLSPSLLCKKCGSHGFIRDGKWVNA